MKNWNSNNWFAWMAAFAFASVISFFQIDSAWADAHHFNWGWTTLGVVFGLSAIFGLYKVTKTSN